MMLMTEELSQMREKLIELLILNLAFYNSIGFDSVPTKETDGFTEQELIDCVLENIITQ